MSSPAAQYLLRNASSAEDWQAALLQIDPAPPLLQAWQWGDFKARHGWQPRRMLWDGNARAAAGAQLLQRSARTFGLNAVIQYVPHGPLLDWRNPALAQTVLADLRTAGKQANAIFIKIDPALALAAPSADASTAAAADLLTRGGWKLSASQIQFRNTVVLDLQQQPEKLLAAFKTKTRYNIRLAQRHGVNVQPATTQQLPALYEMYKQTAQRDGFPIRTQAYYLDLWSSFCASRPRAAADCRVRCAADCRRGCVRLRAAGRVYARHVQQCPPRQNAELFAAVARAAMGACARLHSIRHVGRAGQF